MKKKLLILGGSHFQVPAIVYAKSAGYHVITADYSPSNPGHKFSDEYYNVSTIDKDKILRLAKEKRIDGILSYASDPGAPTAAYIAEKMYLPGNPYESVKILQRKDLFRKFLRSEGYNSPIFNSFCNINQAKEFAEYLLKNTPIIVKPSDSSGSKGVNRMKSIDKFDYMFNIAKTKSQNGIVIVEEFIEKQIYEMDGDGFVWDGKLVFRCFGNQHNDPKCNPYVPVAISFPYIQNIKIQNEAHSIVESIMRKLNMKLGGINIEYLTDRDNNVYILEIGPRNGGNLIPEAIKHATGVNLIELAVESALGKDCSDLDMIEPTGYYSSYIIHSCKNGILKGINISSRMKHVILEQNIWKNYGDIVYRFSGSNQTIGTLLLKFESEEEMFTVINNIDEYIEVIVEEKQA